MSTIKKAILQQDSEVCVVAFDKFVLFQSKSTCTMFQQRVRIIYGNMNSLCYVIKRKKIKLCFFSNSIGLSGAERGQTASCRHLRFHEREGADGESMENAGNAR